MTPPPIRQLQVLRLIAAGFEGPEIAVRLGVTLNTVRTHKQLLFDRLGARNCAQAVAEGFRRGLLAVDRVPA